MKDLAKKPIFLVLLLLVALLTIQYGLDLLITLTIVAIAYGVLYGVYRYANLQPSDIGLGKDSLRTGTKVSLIIICVVAVFSVIAFSVAPDAFLDDRYNQSIGSALIAALVILPIRTVILEELLFRGFLWGILAKQKTELFATLVSSLLFGLWHVLPSRNIGDKAFSGVDLTISEPLVIIGIVFATFLAGVVFSELRRRTRSLLPAIAAHWAINATGILLAALAWR
jgi:membrane protease YdiL (CAAX protease family)